MFPPGLVDALKEEVSLLLFFFCSLILGWVVCCSFFYSSYISKLRLFFFSQRMRWTFSFLFYFRFLVRSRRSTNIWSSYLSISHRYSTKLQPQIIPNLTTSKYWCTQVDTYNYIHTPFALKTFKSLFQFKFLNKL